MKGKYYVIFQKLTKLNLILVCSLILVSSCNKDSGDPDIIFKFQPRECKFVYSVPGNVTSNKYGETNYKEYFDLTDFSKSVKSQEFFLAILTSNFDLSTINNEPWIGTRFPSITNSSIDKSIKSIETQIEAEYIRYLKSMKPTKSVNSVETDLEMIEYRTTGVKDLRITANCKLFGKNAGEDLKNYFYISRYTPKVIISFETNAMLYGFLSDELPESIEEWLSLKPMAQPVIYLEMESIPEELPQTVQFTVELETSSGALISYTSRAITITK